MFFYWKKQAVNGARPLLGKSIPAPLAWVILFLFLCMPTETISATEAPLPARQAGYTQRTFASVFTHATTDTSYEHKRGYQWYPLDFWERTDVDTLKLNGDSSLTLRGNSMHPNSQVATVARDIHHPEKFVGKAFGGGGYFEATLRFNPADIANRQNKGWPAFWALALEHIAGKDGEPGKPKDYGHFIEIDFFEYDLLPLGQNYYGGNLHDWYGIYKKSCPQKPFCDSGLPYAKVKRKVPATVDFTKEHTFGFLWIPATETDKGLGRFYFDGAQAGEDVTWQKFDALEGKPDNQPWKFGIADKQHLVLIIGTGMNQPLTVSSVNVWQRSEDDNLTYP